MGHDLWLDGSDLYKQEFENDFEHTSQVNVSMICSFKFLFLFLLILSLGVFTILHFSTWRFKCDDVKKSVSQYSHLNVFSVIQWVLACFLKFYLHVNDLTHWSQRYKMELWTLSWCSFRLCFVLAVNSHLS